MSGLSAARPDVNSNLDIIYHNSEETTIDFEHFINNIDYVFYYMIVYSVTTNRLRETMTL